jgi:hypothetical protein
MRDLDYIQKGEARVNNQYRFVSHDAVTAKIHPLLVTNGIVVLSSAISTKQDGNRTEILVEVKFCNVDNPTDFVAVNFLGYGIDAADKGPGKAISYAFKYAILKTFVLETGDDPDMDQKTLHEPETKKEPIEYPELSSKAMDDYIGSKIFSLKCDRDIFIAYIDTVAQLKGWDLSRTVYEFERDPADMATKFKKWSARQKPKT